MRHKRFRNVNILHELVTVARFGLVGVLATAVHIACVWTLLMQTDLRPVPANTFAFLLAFGVSFTGHYVWTFRLPGSPRRAMLRYFVIAVSGFAVNTLVLSFLVNKGWFSPVVSALMSASLVPAISFTASRLWGFQASEGG